MLVYDLKKKTYKKYTKHFDFESYDSYINYDYVGLMKSNNKVFVHFLNDFHQANDEYLTSYGGF